MGSLLVALLLGDCKQHQARHPQSFPPCQHTGGPYADGLFASLAEHGVFAERREVVATQFFQRTLIGTPSERKPRIAQKYRVLEISLAKATIIIVDEALIRGDTSQAITNTLLAAGAKAVHWAIVSPPIVAPNYYGSTH
ncbi:hypothetical protein CQ12_25350 [Bradyrhizobium jicamae]|uniref:Phosphoribosyltransferase domain-containing protein n=1 Tax=Bradyrhizobium jicamae TaxID=280332 RepID=A0A0R3LJH5_9BRAD|nr:hypothetical protein CQ12_25350 [Bradyrhizobium jicamae]